MEALWLDARFALRTLARRPLFGAIIVLTLALAIGANTAIFSILDAVVLRPLPYAAPEELVVMVDDFRAFDAPRLPLADHELRALRESATGFVALEGWSQPFEQALTDDAGRPEQISVIATTPGAIPLLGVRPLSGRPFTEAEGLPLPASALADPASAPASVVLLSHSFWQRRYGSDPSILDRTIELDSRPHRVIGVMAPEFRLFWPVSLAATPEIRVDAYVPLETDIANATTGGGYLQVVGRLREGVSRAQAQEEVDAITAQQREEHERAGRLQIHTQAAALADEVSQAVRPALVAMLGAVAIVLLLACANIANLMLARGIERRQEIAVRAAIGAGRLRLFRQSLTESLVVALLGGALGLVVASWGSQTILASVPADLPRADEVAVNPAVALFTLGVTLVALVLSGLAPAWALSRPAVVGASAERGGGMGRRHARARAAVVVAEIALALVLLVGAGLMLRSFAALRAVELGFEPTGVSTFQVTLPRAEYPDATAQAAFLRAVRDRVTGLAGVQSAAVGTAVPFGGGGASGTFLTEEQADDERPFAANYRGVTRGYFETLEIPHLAGRVFEPEEQDHRVALIDRRLAEEAFPGGDSLDKTIRMRLASWGSGGSRNEQVRIVGVVESVRDGELIDEGLGTIYFTHELFGLTAYTIAVRAEQPIEALTPLVIEQIEAVDPELPVYAVRPLTGYVDDAVAQTRFTLSLLGLFGAAAVLLAVLGLYGILAQAVRRQAREIGVRLALGSTAGDEQRRVVRQGAVLALVGTALGIALALPLTRALRSLFVGVEPTDPLTLTATALLLVLVAVSACYLPARRASRLDPAQALRE